MTTRNLVNAELVAMLDLFPTLALTAESLLQTRAFLKEMNAQAPTNLPDFSAISVSECHVPEPQGAPDVRVLVSPLLA
ncbi:MAG: hypothetical protein ABI234_10305 [Ktedonobacteraceae bacterium]